jgi:hypothetical protein
VALALTGTSQAFCRDRAPLVEFLTWLQRQYYDRGLAGLALTIRVEPNRSPTVREWPLFADIVEKLAN